MDDDVEEEVEVEVEEEVETGVAVDEDEDAGACFASLDLERKAVMISGVASATLQMRIEGVACPRLK